MGKALQGPAVLWVTGVHLVSTKPLHCAAMKLSDFHYSLPEGLIAQDPLASRGASRLLHLERPSGSRVDLTFRDLPGLLRAGDLLVFNDTKVLPARLQGRKLSGGKVEILLERILEDNTALVQIRASKSPKPGSRIRLQDDTELEVQGRLDQFFHIRMPNGDAIMEVFVRLGHMPLPPYITRPDQASDAERYQTVYAKTPGAVAAPTAGLHFEQSMLDELQARGVSLAYLTLHVGAGTFQPVRVENIKEHRMHAEWFSLSNETVEMVRRTHKSGGRVVAVGTTSLRALETAAGEKGLQPFQGESRLFIYPGYKFKLVDGLITNFHLPESTLLMLVSAFAGHREIMSAYRYAVQRKYRFFSYGDAMAIL